MKPKLGEGTFDDLLGGFTTSKTKDGPKTIKEMRTDQLAQDIDPDELKVSSVFDPKNITWKMVAA